MTDYANSNKDLALDQWGYPPVLVRVQEQTTPASVIQKIAQFHQASLQGLGRTIRQVQSEIETMKKHNIFLQQFACMLTPAIMMCARPHYEMKAPITCQVEYRDFRTNTGTWVMIHHQPSRTDSISCSSQLK